MTVCVFFLNVIIWFISCVRVCVLRYATALVKLPLKCWKNNNTMKRCVLSVLLIFVNLVSLEYLIFILVVISSITSEVELFEWERRMFFAMQLALLWTVNSHYLLIFLLPCLPFSHQYVRVVIHVVCIRFFNGIFCHMEV